jgi:alkyldihydroxyacetonephosphate synthase
MRTLVKKRVYPASVRLVDSLQFRFAIAFSGSPEGKKKQWIQKISKFYLTKIKGYDPYKLSVATLLFEGSKVEVAQQQKLLYEIAKQNNGLQAGAENGHKGYNLTFLIAYIRDFLMDHNFIAESLETSAPWTNILSICENTKKQIFESAKKYGIDKDPIVTFRITLLYETVI